MGASVQFYGIDSVMQAAQNRECPCWGIWINGRMFSKYESNDLTASMAMLQTNLEMLEESNANAVYTLKFFECNNGQPIKINEKSVSDGGSFNFKLIDQDERAAGVMRVSGYSKYIQEMQTEIADLKQQLAEKDQDDDEPETIGSVLLDLVKNPQQLAYLVNVFKSITGGPQVNLGAMAGVLPGGQVETAEVQDDQLNRTAAALDTLEKSDPNFSTHIEKLAKIAKENPDQFRMLLNML